MDFHSFGKYLFFQDTRFWVKIAPCTTGRMHRFLMEILLTGYLFVLLISIVWFAKFLLYEPKKKCVVFISFSHSHKSPYILKVIANLIKEYFSSRSVYISVLLCSVLLLATFTEAQRLFSAQLKHIASQAYPCPDICNRADYVLQAPVAALLPCHDHNQALHLFLQWCKR